MIKVIKTGELPKKNVPQFRITCSKCGTIFECTAEDCRRIPASQGFWAWAILCPVCHEECSDWQGGSAKWEWF